MWLTRDIWLDAGRGRCQRFAGFLSRLAWCSAQSEESYHRDCLREHLQQHNQAHYSSMLSLGWFSRVRTTQIRFSENAKLGKSVEKKTFLIDILDRRNVVDWGVFKLFDGHIQKSNSILVKKRYNWKNYDSERRTCILFASVPKKMLQ